MIDLPGENGAKSKHGIGRDIGPYRLVELIGEGGMGEVFLAEQQQPIRRQVALKIIKLGMDTRDFVTRFESELQAMAKMDHPYIAQVHDAGATDRGRPYFVMEYIQGVPLLQYCDEHRMGIEDRIELFTKICEGIQHAHQKAIIHRDLKSSNVLVVEENGEAWPKIIDFGVAKVLGEKITEQTIQTQMGQIMGTPEFMSPEQADLTGGSIDTRTDVYLLGEVLYELLSGLPPFDSEEMRKSGIDGMLYKIRMIDPPRPSIRLKELGREAESLAAVRGLSADKLIHLLSGDLDWIVMMALEKSPDLRYQTAHAMIADLRNYRASLPITARPPSTSYRVRKFVNRHRTGVAAAGFVFVAIILGITGTTVGMIRSQRAEKLASTEAATAKEVSDFMVGLFEVSDPGEARGNAVTAREILERGVMRIEQELTGQPFTQARLMNTMGRVYMELGLYGESKELLAKSLDTMVELDAEDDPQAAVILNDFGHLQRERGEFATARTYLESALAIREENFGPKHELVAQSLNSLANLFYAQGEYDEALQAYERALAIREGNLGPDHPEVAIILKNIGAVHMVTRDYQLAEEALARSLAIRETSLPANHPDISNSLTALAVFFDELGKYEKSLEYFERSLAIRETVYGPDHPQVAENLSGMASVLGYMGDFEQSDELFKRALRFYEDSLGPEHPKVGATLVSFGYMLFDSGRNSQAESTLERGLAIIAESSGPNSVKMQRGLEVLGLIKQRNQEFEEALDYFERVREVQETNFGPDYGPLASTYNNIGLAWITLGEFARARAALDKGLAVAEKSGGDSSPQIPDCLLNLGYIDILEGDFETAGARLHRANRILTATRGTENRDTAFSMGRLGLLEYYQGHHEMARSYFNESVEIQTRLLPASHQDLLMNHYNLACLNAVLGDEESALKHLRLAVENGFSNPYILEDPDLNSLRGNAEFERLVAMTTAKN